MGQNKTSDGSKASKSVPSNPPAAKRQKTMASPDLAESAVGHYDADMSTHAFNQAGIGAQFLENTPALGPRLYGTIDQYAAELRLTPGRAAADAVPPDSEHGAREPDTGSWSLPNADGRRPISDDMPIDIGISAGFASNAATQHGYGGQTPAGAGSSGPSHAGSASFDYGHPANLLFPPPPPPGATRPLTSVMARRWHQDGQPGRANRERTLAVDSLNHAYSGYGPDMADYLAEWEGDFQYNGGNDVNGGAGAS